MDNWPKVLIVDDEPQQTALAGHMVKDVFPSAVIHTAKDAEEGLKDALTFHPDLVITDVRMGSTNGIDLCRALKQDSVIGTNVKVITMTGYPDLKNANDAAQSGVDAYLSKPIEVATWRAHLDRVLKRTGLRRTKDTFTWEG